ncbi:MAG: UDP-2,3-diacylglucosamine diphosphatase [Usitatibacteraceae bacterium]
MRPVFFVSDIHLCVERPRITRMFKRFIAEIAPNAGAVYILGDLFEYWLGDDQLDADALAREIAESLHRLASSGTRLYFMHGNRDFLLAGRFASEASLTILSDPTVIQLGHEQVILMHGDTLCTDDAAYQAFRRQVRSAAWQQGILAKPYAERVELARSIRSQSDIEKSMKPEAIMDVNADAVAAVFKESVATVLVHGHTHRPARHVHLAGNCADVRWVLQDWHDIGGYLSYADGDWRAVTIKD